MAAWFSFALFEPHWMGHYVAKNAFLMAYKGKGDFSSHLKLRNLQCGIIQFCNVHKLCGLAGKVLTYDDFLVC